MGIPFMKLKKSRGYFPNTPEGQKEYEKQWENDEQCGPTRVRTDYSRFTRPEEYPKKITNS